MNSIIHGLSTFFVLLYAKVTTVSGLLLSSATLFGRLNIENEVQSVVQLDGIMDYFHKEHYTLC